MGLRGAAPDTIVNVTSTQRDALTVVDGDLIYNTTLGVHQARQGGRWVNVPLIDSWIPDANSWTFASKPISQSGSVGATATVGEYTITTTVDVTGYLEPGTRMKLTHSTVKYFIVTKVVWNGTTTSTVTLIGPVGQADLSATGGLSLVSYSNSKKPFGFPIDTAKWTVALVDATARSQAVPTASTWYNMGGLGITIPIGAWRVWYEAQPVLQVTSGTLAAGDPAVTLSTTTNSETDVTMTCRFEVGIGTSAYSVMQGVHKERQVTLTADTAYKLLGLAAFSNAAATLYFYAAAAVGNTIIHAESLYV